MVQTLMGSLRRVLLLVTLLIGCSAAGHAVPWFSYGPNGGSARAFAVDPKDPTHLYMGTANGWIFQSRDGGKSWLRLAQLADRDDLVIDNILVDPLNPHRLIVGAWVLGDLSHPDGGIYISEDGGTRWTSVAGMKGQSIRALVIAPSDPKIFLAGTLEGVFRSNDSGVEWQRISPKENREIHEVESLAVDPADPNKIYAGTWHLPWKTTDGGATWSSMNNGLIEDSDVFSIIVDPKQSNVLYLSACSGIYKSVDGGGKFTGGVGQNKVQGIPVDARRTRVLMQDPNHLDTVYAGTTEGLYRTTDAGKTWILKTGPDVIVNDVYVDPSNSEHVLLATDRGGVLMSNDGAATFAGSNDGFSARQVTAFVQDAHDPAVVYVGVVNDKDRGGVFVSRQGGMSWTHLGDGLAGNDVTSLIQAPDGGILAGTGHGIYRLQDDVWRRQGIDVKAKTRAPMHAAAVVQTSATVRRTPAVKPVQTFVDEDVYDFAVNGSTLYAATSAGLLTSVNNGMTWTAVDSMPTQDWRHVTSTKNVIAAASLDASDTSTIAMSVDGGKSWKAVTPPAKATQILALAVDGEGGLWIGDRDCVYYSTDKGATWDALTSPVVRNVRSLYYDQSANRILLAARIPEKKAFAIDPGTQMVTSWDAGWNLRFLRPVGTYLIGATMFDGIVVQPRMVDSALVAKH
jgi:photosystem II stability/assembly factor-like uncharacterized protein